MSIGEMNPLYRDGKYLKQWVFSGELLNKMKTWPKKYYENPAGLKGYEGKEIQKSPPTAKYEAEWEKKKYDKK
jgi:hypothetical protein